MSVAELRNDVAEVADDVKQHENRINALTIEVRALVLRQDMSEKRGDERHAEVIRRMDDQWAFVQKLLIGLGGAAVSIILALLGLIGANPDLISAAMAGATGP